MLCHLYLCTLPVCVFTCFSVCCVARSVMSRSDTACALCHFVLWLVISLWLPWLLAAVQLIWRLDCSVKDVSSLTLLRTLGRTHTGTHTHSLHPLALPLFCTPLSLFISFSIFVTLFLSLYLSLSIHIFHVSSMSLFTAE